MMKRMLVVAAGLLLLAGCSVNETFVYKPSPPVVGEPVLAVKIAVLPFADGTGEYTRHGYVNLAKTGIDYGVGAFTPNRWGKAFAEELAASGGFKSVRFVSELSQGANDEVIVAGTVTKADIPIIGGADPLRFAVSLNARTGRGGPPFWEKVVTREDASVNGYALGCGLSRQCAIDRRHAHHNDLLRGMFLEASADLAKSLLSRSGSRGRGGLYPGASSPSVPAAESVDETIEDILKGK